MQISLVTIFMYLAIAYFGAFCIMLAMYYQEQRRYFYFGLQIMNTVAAAVMMVKLIFIL